MPPREWDDLCCLITLSLFNDPVQIALGQTYERVAIEEWLATSTTDLMTGKELSNPALSTPDLDKKIACDRHRKLEFSRLCDKPAGVGFHVPALSPAVVSLRCDGRTLQKHDPCGGSVAKKRRNESRRVVSHRNSIESRGVATSRPDIAVSFARGQKMRALQSPH